MSGTKNLKKEIKEFLEKEDFDQNPKGIHKFPPLKVVNVLFSLLVTTDPFVRSRAVSAMGEVVSKLAESDLEVARTVMRRLMLSLNDESGGIGWGSPEAMGEIMARSERLAEEYHNILISYTSEGGNHLEFAELQKGVIAGLRRLAEVRPALVKRVEHLLK